MTTISSLPTSYQSIVYQSLFKKADANGDGSLSSGEVSNSLNQIKSTLGESTLKADSLFTMLDADNSKAVSRSEFSKGLASIVSGSSAAGSADATTSRQEVIASYRNGIQSNLVSSLLSSTSSTSSSSSAYSTLSDVYSLLEKQYGMTLNTYSANGSSSGSSLVGSLLNASA